MSKPTLSLWSALCININIMFGTGIFINTVTLTHLTGLWGFFTYALVAILISPLIIALAALIKQYPIGGFYVYGASISPFIGFISAWAYFIGKLASAALLIHVFSSLLFTILPSCNDYLSIYTLDFIILTLFAYLNTRNMKTSSTIIYTFIVLKLTPIIFTIFACLYLYHYWSVAPEYLSMPWQGISSAIPLVLYAFTGFEASCSLSRSIKNPAKNGPKAILYSFIIVVLITILYQGLLFITFSDTLLTITNYLNLFPAIIPTIVRNKDIAHHLINLFHIALACSALGGSYGILFSNHWNLYTLAEHKIIPGWRWLTHLNRYHIPVLGVMVEVALCIMYLLYTHFNIVILQQISVLGCTIAYTLSIAALIKHHYHQNMISCSSVMAYASLLSCLLLIGCCIRNFVLHGAADLLLFGLLIGLGILGYGIMSQRKLTF